MAATHAGLSGEALLRGALHASPLPLLVHAEDGEILLVSRSWGDITGYGTWDMATISDWTRLAYGDRAPAVEAGIARLFDAEGPVSEGEFKVRTRDGETRIWDFSSAPLGTLPDGRRVVMSVAHDVTVRLAAQDEVRRLNQTLEERVASRTRDAREAYAELETFSYSVAHDLRAPLRAINGYAELILREHAGWLDDTGRERLSAIARAAVGMGRLIDDLLAFSQVTRNMPDHEVLDMDALVAEARSRILPAYPRFGDTVSAEALPRAWGNPELVLLVLTNLLDNALKYSASNPEGAVRISGTVEGGYATFTVRDNGVGFDPAQSHRIFGVFERLHGEEFPGTGVGLALVRRIVERHGGSVRAEGIPGKGAAVTFSLPHRGTREAP